MQPHPTTKDSSSVSCPSHLWKKSCSQNMFCELLKKRKTYILLYFNGPGDFVLQRPLYPALFASSQFRPHPHFTTTLLSKNFPGLFAPFSFHHRTMERVRGWVANGLAGGRSEIGMQGVPILVPACWAWLEMGGALKTGSCNRGWG